MNTWLPPGGPLSDWVGFKVLLRFAAASQVSSGEATTAALRLEEMTAALEGQQRELESLRDAQAAREQEQRQDKDNHHHQKVAIFSFPSVVDPPFSVSGSIAFYTARITRPVEK